MTDNTFSSSGNTNLLRQNEIAMLQEGICPRRYERNVPMFGLEGQRTLLESHVAVVGCGGLGGYCVELLARNGVGQITLIDGDVFEESNLNRQILATIETLKHNKAEIAAKRVQDINPAVSTNIFSVFADRTNLAKILRHVPDSPCQMVIDAVDSIPGKLMLADFCSRMNIPMIHGALAGSYGQVSVLFPGDDTLKWLYPQEFTGTSAQGDEKVLGTPGMTPPLVASLRVTEVLKLLLHKNEPAQRQKVTFLDIMQGIFVTGLCSDKFCSASNRRS